MEKLNYTAELSLPLESDGGKKRLSIFKVMAAYFAMSLVLELLRLAIYSGWFDGLSDMGLEAVWTVVTQIIVFTAVPAVLFMFSSGAKGFKGKLNFTAENLGLTKKVPLKVVLLSLAAGVAMYIVTLLVSSIFLSALMGTGYVPSSSDGEVDYTFPAFLLSLLLTAVLPAIGEEITHRGMLVHAFKGRGDMAAILWSALLFGLMHGNIEQVFYAALVMGVIGGIISVKTGSIVPCMILHFVNNAIAVILTYTSYEGGFGYKLQEALSNSSAAIFVFYLLAAASIFFIIVYVHITVCSMRPKSESELEAEARKKEAEENAAKEAEEAARRYAEERSKANGGFYPNGGAYPGMNGGAYGNMPGGPGNYPPQTPPNTGYGAYPGAPYNNMPPQNNGYSGGMPGNNYPGYNNPYGQPVPPQYGNYPNYGADGRPYARPESKFETCRKRMAVIMREDNQPEYTLTRAQKIKNWIFISGTLAITVLMTLFTYIYGFFR